MSGIKRSANNDIQDLRRLLTDQYDQRSLWKELVQNADDAGARHLHFTYMSEIAGHSHPLLATPAVCVLNDGAFSKVDAERIPYMGISSKGAEAGSIGKFGLGMKSIFHLCEAFFYLASPNQEAAKDKNPGEHYWECLNPWENTGVQPTWNTGCPDLLRELAKPLIAAIEKWPHSLDRWFALWVPLRTRQHREYPLTKNYQKPQDVFPADLSTNLATLLPLMQNLETISVWKDTDDGQQKQFSLQVHPKTTRRQKPEHLVTGNENKLSGTISFTHSTDQQENTSLWFAGSEVKLNDTELKSLEGNGWPINISFDDVTGKEKHDRESAIPHAAALWSKSHSNKNEPAKLIIGDAVFLPLPDPTEEVSLTGASSQFRLMLHGYFFLDAGRRHLHNDPDKVQGKWNERLRKVGTLPLVLPALSDFVKHAALSAEEVRALSQGFENSKCWTDSKVLLGGKHQWLYRIAPGGGHWLLLDAQEEYRIIPKPQKDQSNLPFTVFPALRDLSKTEVFTFKEWPRLSMHDDSAWDDNILELLLDSMDAKQVFYDFQSFKYFNDVLDLAPLRSEKITARLTARLIELAREALIELDWKVLKNCKQEWQRLLRVLPDSKWISLALTNESDKAREAMLRDLLSLQLQRLVIPPELAPDQDKSEKFSLSDAQKLFNWLEKNRTDISRARLVPEILRRTTGSLDEKRRFCGSQRLFKVREWMSGIEGSTERHLSWGELEDCRIKKQLWGNHKSGEELLSAWQKATNNTTLCALIEDGTRPFSKALFNYPPTDFNNADCMELLSQAPELHSPEDRKDLFGILLKSVENHNSKKALRYLLHGEQLHANNLTVSLLASGEESGKEDESERTWQKLTERILTEEKGSWRCVPNNLTELLSSQQKKSLDVYTVNKSSVADLLAQYTGDISTLNLGRELEEVERHRALKELGESEDSSLWFKLALHRTINGQLVSIDPTKTFIDSDVPMPELLRSEVVLLKSPTPSLLDIYKRHGIKEWSWKDVLRFASQHPAPAKLSKVILDALGNISNDDVKDFSSLSNIAWLPHCDGKTAVKPEDVIFLPEIEDDLNRLLSGPSLKGVWFSPSSLSNDVTKHSAWSKVEKELLSKRKRGLEMLGECLVEHGGYHLGSLRSLQEIADSSTESTKALDDLLVTFDGAPDDLLPLIPLLRALKRNTKGTELLPLLQLLNNEIAPQQLVKCLQFLEQRCQETSSTQQETCKKVHRWYLEILVAHTDFKPALLADLKLLNKRDQWTSTSSLCLEAEGLDERCILHEEQARLLRSQLKKNQPQSGETCANQNEDFGKETDVAPRLEKYFASWRGQVPHECIGLLLSLLGETNNLHQLAEGYLGNRDLESIRRRLLRLEPTQNFKVNYGFLVNVVKDTSDNTYVGLNLLREKTNFRIAKNFEHLVIGDLGWKYTKKVKACYVIHLRKIEPNVFSKTELKGLLYKTILQILEEGHKSKEHSLDEVWEDLAQTEQADLEVAQSMILENSFFYFNQLPSKPNGNLKRIVKDWDSMRHLIVEERRDGNSSGGRSEKKKQELSEELRELLLYDGVAQDQTLQAIRKKVQQAEYKADSIPFELFQNADDAAVELVDGYGQNLGEQDTQRSQRIVVQWDEKYFQLLHWGRAINDFRVGEITNKFGREKGYHRDLEKMLVLQSSDKADDETTTGKFGLGFKSVFLATRTPRVLSGQLGFEVVGGMYPRRLETNEYERLKNLLNSDKENNNQRGTIIELPLDVEYLSDFSQHWLERFERLLPLLLVFARHLKRCNIDSPEKKQQFVWNETNVDDQGSVAIGDLRNVINSDKQDALPPRGLVLRVTPPQHKGALLLGLDARGFRALPSDTPAFWATAPTRETISVGFALDGNWTLDVGRAQLAHGEDNLTEAQRLGQKLGKSLEMLFAASTDWAVLKSKLKLADDVSLYDFWYSFWKIVSGDVCKKDERLNYVLWGNDGMITSLITDKAILPTGLPGEYRTLTCLNKAEWFTTGKLNDSNIFQCVSQWPAFTQQWQPQRVVSKDIVNKLPQQASNLRPLQLLDVLKQDADSELISPQQATRWAETLLPRWEKWDETEKQELTKWLRTQRFRASDNKPYEASRLLVQDKPTITSAEESLRARFAPTSYVLSTDYDDAGIKLFKICREKMSADAKKLADWGRYASTSDAQAAFLNYLLKGELWLDVANAVVMHKPENGWLFKLKENLAFKKLNDNGQNHILNSLNLLPPQSDLLLSTEPQTSSRPVDATKKLNQIYDWWHGSGKNKLSEYENELFPHPHDVYPYLKEDISLPKTRKAWLTFLLRGSLESMGQVTEAQQKGFIALCERRGWIEELSQSRPAAKELGTVIEKYFDEQTKDLPYLHWIRHGLPLLLLSRWLDEYIGLFQGLNTRTKLDMSFLSSRVDSAMSGGGYSAPPLWPILGIGTHWILRELARKNIVTTSLAHPFCYHPTKATRDVITALDGPNLESIKNDRAKRAEQSKQIHLFLRKHIGDKATFSKAFDLPLALLRKNHDMLTNLNLNIPESTEEGDDNE